MRHVTAAPRRPDIAADGVERGQVVLDELVGLLDLDETGPDTFHGLSPESRRFRVYGGQVAGQALVAAGRTVPPGRTVHSLHSYFVRGGDPRTPIEYRTERIRDGRSFTTRRVLAVQGDEAIFMLSASFQVPQEGLVHTETAPSDVPPPESLPDLGERRAAGHGGDWLGRAERPIDIRFVDEPVWTADRVATQEPIRAWLRADGVLSDDPLLHACLLTWASDMMLLSSVVARHDMSATAVQMASLDHAMWFHAPFRADEWLLYECWSPAASGGRGLATGRFFTRDGTMIASTAQEGLVRLPRNDT
ncbi:MAG: acyl-CoA thioesterase II [Pseudonocardia sp.]|nr:acyl-CoA thioesterase II [Pseudonocardia sp.]ODV07458.1 MAG: acyl-CoA thioesterase II [Pseudonocardia sp. SCN 73-27]